jgi:hypothetical protein
VADSVFSFDSLDTVYGTSPADAGGYGDLAATGNADTILNVNATQAPVPLAYSPSVDGMPTFLDGTVQGTGQINAPDPTALPLTGVSTNAAVYEAMNSSGVPPSSTDYAAWNTYIGADPVSDTSVPSGVGTNATKPPATFSFGQLIGSIFGNNVAGVAGTGAASSLTRASVATKPLTTTQTAGISLPGIGNVATAVSSNFGIIALAALGFLLFWKLKKV